MNNRHRVPTVFSIYMLDVICCALGCVILLWQVAHYEAEEQTAAAQESSSAADAAHVEIDVLRRTLTERERDAQRLGAKIMQVERERDEAARLSTLHQAEYDKLQRDYRATAALLKQADAERAQLDKERQRTVLELADKGEAQAKLLLLLAAAQQKTTALAKQVAAGKLDAETAAERLAEQRARRTEAEARSQSLDQQLATLRKEQQQLQAQLTTQTLRAKVLEQDLERNKKGQSASASDAATAIAALQKERAQLTDQVRAVQAEADQRFAGIALTGKNVLFLVDMSGSMAMRDEKTADPDKWPLVCETVVQLMRSLKTLRFFQVLLFSDELRYPLGNAAAWLPYDPVESPKRTLAALKKVTPEGETNMHAVFAEAFRYREAKLDTLYVFSDGLPNAGNGVARTLSEAERTTVLSKDLRTRLKTDWNRPIVGQPQVRINSIGFFFESPDVGAFLWALSREHQGSFVGMSK